MCRRGAAASTITPLTMTIASIVACQPSTAASSAPWCQPFASRTRRPASRRNRAGVALRFNRTGSNKDEKCGPHPFRPLLLWNLALAREFHRLRIVFRIVDDRQSGVLRSGFGRRKHDPECARPARLERPVAVIACHAVGTARATVAFHHDRNTGLLFASTRQSDDS